MRFREIVQESVDFGPRREVKPKYFSWPEEFSRREHVDCFACKGSGRDIQWEVHPRREREPDYVDPCEFCDGKGKKLEWVFDFPELNVSNRNASVIASLLGHEPDPGGREGSTGFIRHEDLPAVRRRLIRIKNGDLDPFTIEPSETRERRVDRSGDIPTISHGPTMIDFGVSHQTIERYVARVLEIVVWAQENNCGVGWA